MTDGEHLHLPRLDAEWYRGFAFVHWNMTIRDRRRGWLDDRFHTRFREVLLHALFKHESACPAYCLMPDHLHLLVLGWDESADQRKLVTFLRRHLNTELRPDYELQKQAYDNVLKEDDRERDAVQRAAYYIAENPVRAELAASAEAYPFTGRVVPGYPELDRLYWNDSGIEFWQRFWRIYASKLP